MLSLKTRLVSSCCAYKPVDHRSRLAAQVVEFLFIAHKGCRNSTMSTMINTTLRRELGDGEDSNNRDVPLECGPPSKLGTKQYWDATYRDELSQFKQDGLAGQVWYGSHVVKKMVEWTVAHVQTRVAETKLDKGSRDSASAARREPELMAIAEIGCGNAHLLLQLARRVETTHLTGIDYSPAAQTPWPSETKWRIACDLSWPIYCNPVLCHQGRSTCCSIRVHWTPSVFSRAQLHRTAAAATQKALVICTLRVCVAG